MYLAGVDGCPVGWVIFRAEVPSLATTIKALQPIELEIILKQKPADLALIGIDIPIGLLDGPRACDAAARKLLGKPRNASVFAAP